MPGRRPRLSHRETLMLLVGVIIGVLLAAMVHHIAISPHP